MAVAVAVVAAASAVAATVAAVATAAVAVVAAVMGATAVGPQARGGATIEAPVPVIGKIAVLAPPTVPPMALMPAGRAVAAVAVSRSTRTDPFQLGSMGASEPPNFQLPGRFRQKAWFCGALPCVP